VPQSKPNHLRKRPKIPSPTDLLPMELKQSQKERENPRLRRMAKNKKVMQLHNTE